MRATPMGCARVVLFFNHHHHHQRALDHRAKPVERAQRPFSGPLANASIAIINCRPRPSSSFFFRCSRSRSQPDALGMGKKPTAWRASGTAGVGRTCSELRQAAGVGREEGKRVGIER
jgi:hypothetical protein